MIFSTSTLLLATMVVNAASVIGAPIRMANTVSEPVARSVPIKPTVPAAIVDVQDNRPRSRLGLNSRRLARLAPPDERDESQHEVVEAREPEPSNPSAPVVQERERRFPRRVYHDFYKREPATSIKETITIKKTTVFDTPADAAANARVANAGSVAAVAAAAEARASSIIDGSLSSSTSITVSSTTVIPAPNGVASAISSASASLSSAAASATATASADDTAASASSTASASGSASASSTASAAEPTKTGDADGEDAPKSGATVVSSTSVPAAEPADDNKNDRREVETPEVRDTPCDEVHQSRDITLDDSPVARDAPAAGNGKPHGRGRHPHMKPPAPSTSGQQTPDQQTPGQEPAAEPSAEPTAGPAAEPAAEPAADPSAAPAADQQSSETRRWVVKASSSPVARRLASSGASFASALRRREADLASVDSLTLRNVNTENS